MIFSFLAITIIIVLAQVEMEMFSHFLFFSLSSILLVGLVVSISMKEIPKTVSQPRIDPEEDFIISPIPFFNSCKTNSFFVIYVII
jgi:hypothetical protein